MTNLSEAAKRALAGAKGSRMGTEVQGDAATLNELKMAGMIGFRDGLTRKGSIAAEREQNKALDNAFGPL